MARIENHKYSIEEAFRERFYIVPDYQRECVWTDKEVHQLLEGVARGFYGQHLVDTGVMKSGSDIARGEGLYPSVPNELMRLTLLTPDILELRVAERQPRRMNLIWFQRNPLPVDWEAQRQIVSGFFVAA